MLAAGQDLDRALRFVVDNTRNARARAILDRVRDKVRAGRSLAAALAGEPRSFSQLYVGLVRAGEAGGTLPATLDRLAACSNANAASAPVCASALIYPALLIVAAIGSIVLLLDYVLPQFTPIFEQAGAQAADRDPHADGARLGQSAPPGPIFCGIAGRAGLVAYRLLAQPAYRLGFDRLLLRAAGPRHA